MAQCTEEEDIISSHSIAPWKEIGTKFMDLIGRTIIKTVTLIINSIATELGT